MADKKKGAASPVRVEKTRSQFRSLLAANPNYFGNVPETGFKLVKKVATNTSFEELTSLGYNQHTKRLYATLDVKKAGGYSGNLCDDGSNEYVRFFVDFGGGWQDAGIVATDVHDIPADKDCANKDQHPLTYSLELPYSPLRKWCTSPQLPVVRAILSWNVEPPAGDPNFTPVYGNVLECHIQIDKSWWFKDFLDELVVVADIPSGLLDSVLPVIPEVPEVPEIPGLPEPPIPGPGPIQHHALSVAELIEAYEIPSRSKAVKLSVEPHRLAFRELQALEASATNDVAGLANLSAALSPIGFDLDDLVIAIEDTTGDISYEELIDVGLDYNREKLVATYKVKKSSGFSGGLCTSGSLEHVAFWADWNGTCEWEYLDTVSVRAYDFEMLPDGGLCYSAALPVDLAEFKEKCEDPKVARVRAVLSWTTPPSTTDPGLLPTWGNRLDAHVLVPRQEGAPGSLTLIGGISTEFISDVTGLASNTAKFADTGISVYTPAGLDVPFGGLVVVRGPAIVGKRYRLHVVDSAAASQNLNEKIWVTPTVGMGSYHTSDADGWFDYLPYTQNFSAVLGYFRSTGNDRVTIQLEIEGDGIVDSQAIQLDNTSPDVSVSITEPGTDCGLFSPGTHMEGIVHATDDYMGGWSVRIDGGPAGYAPVTVLTGTADTPLSGQVWAFDVPDDMEQCGYVVVATARDRAIVNSGNHQHVTHVDVGFCIIDN